MNRKLRAARISKCWSERDVYSAIGADKRTYQRWEAGQIPQPYYRKKLCELFGLGLEELGLLPSHVTVADEPKRTQDALSSVPAGGQMIMLSQEQIAALYGLLSLGDTDMAGFSQSKRNALAKLFGAKNTQTPMLKSEYPSFLSAGMSRRHALATIIGTTAAALGLSHDIGFPHLRPEEALLLCSSNLPLCWSLYFEGGLEGTKECIAPYCEQLTHLVANPAYQKQAATLASQAYQLSALVEILHHNLGVALDRAKRSVEFAELTDDSNLKTAAHIRLAVVLSNLRQPQQRLAAYEQALEHSSYTSPLLQARVYSGLSETYSELGDKKSALKYVDLTHETISHDYVYSNDPNYSFTHFDPWSIHMYERDVWVNLGQPERAWETLEKSHKLVESGMTVNRVDLTLKQADTAVLLGNLEEGSAHLLNAAKGASLLGSQLLTADAQRIYRDMRRAWPREQKVLDLQEQLYALN